MSGPAAGVWPTSYVALSHSVWYVVSQCQLMVGVFGDAVSCFGADGEWEHVIWSSPILFLNSG